MSKRTDCHRPGAIVPADYTAILYYSAPAGSWCGYNWAPSGAQCTDHEDCRADAAIGLACRKAGDIPPTYALHYSARLARGSLTHCAVCGAHFASGTIYRHVSGDFVAFGHECSDKYDLAADHAEWSAAQDMRERALLAQRTKMLREKTWTKFRAAEPELVAAFEATYPQGSFAARVVPDIAARVQEYGSISPKQRALVLRLHAELLTPPPPPERPASCAAPEGRVRFQGRLVSRRVEESAYGSTPKGLVVVTTPAGEWKVWLTLPRGTPEGTGCDLDLTATLTPKGSFAIGKRPVLHTPAVAQGGHEA